MRACPGLRGSGALGVAYLHDLLVLGDLGAQLEDLRRGEAGRQRAHVLAHARDGLRHGEEIAESDVAFGGSAVNVGHGVLQGGVPPGHLVVGEHPAALRRVTLALRGRGSLCLVAIVEKIGDGLQHLATERALRQQTHARCANGPDRPRRRQEKTLHVGGKEEHGSGAHRSDETS